MDASPTEGCRTSEFLNEGDVSVKPHSLEKSSSLPNRSEAETLLAKHFDIHDPPDARGVAVTFRSRLYKLSEVKPQDGTFTVDIGIYCSWKDCRIARLPVSNRSLHAIDFSSHWQPRWILVKTVEEPLMVDHAIEIIDPVEGRMQQYRHLRVKLDARFEMAQFPFDCQVLKLRVRLPRHLQQGIKDVSCDTSVVESLSLDLQHNEYHVMKITSQVVFAGDKEKHEKTHDDAVWGQVAIPGQCQSPGAMAHWHFSRQKLAQQVRTNRKPEYEIHLYVQRQPEFWNYAIIVPNFCLTLIGLNAFRMQPSELNDRISLVVTLILTFVAFKFSISERLPVLPYLTLLDKWLLSMFGVYCYVGLESTMVHAAQTSCSSRTIQLVDRCSTVGCVTFIVTSTLCLTIYHQPGIRLGLLTAMIFVTTYALSVSP